MKRVASFLRFQIVRLLRPSPRMRADEIRSILLFVLFAYGTFLLGQAQPAATSARPRINGGIFVTTGVMNTQLPYYADNAAGVNFGAFLQLTHLVGVEVRGSTYPISARFTQAPITGGLRIISARSPGRRWLPFGYLGAGVSRAQDSGPTYQPTAATWSPCWQTSGGIDVVFRRFSLRAAEASWTKTYAAQNQLRSLSISTGFVYRFGRSGEKESNEKAALAIARTIPAVVPDIEPNDADSLVSPQ